MVDLRDEIDSVVPSAFAFAQEFMFWEEFGIIKRELLRNVVIGKSKFNEGKQFVIVSNGCHW